MPGQQTKPPRWLGSYCGIAITILAALLLSTASRAVTVSIASVDVSSSNALDALAAGDVVTIGIVLSNPDNEYIAGFDSEAFGWDPNVLRLNSVDATSTVFVSEILALPTGPVAVGGLTMSGVVGSPQQIQSQNAQFFGAVQLATSSGSGLLDTGVDGNLIQDGDVHARIAFEVLGGGATTISIGSLSSRGMGAVIASRSDLFGADTTTRHEGTNIETVDLFALGDPFEPPPEEDDPVEPPEEEEEDPVDTGVSTGGGSTRWGSTGGGRGIVSAVPEPGAALLFATGLASVAWTERRR